LSEPRPSKKGLGEHIEEQINKAIESARLVVFMVDIREGLVPLDEQIGRLLHREGLEVIGVANKADTARMFSAAGEFSKLGFGEFLCISAKNNLNKAVLLDRVFERIGHLELERPAEPVMKIAIVGKRNSGKSTLVNAMVGSERVIRATRSIQRADVVLLLIDATVSVSQVDKKLARFIADEYRSCIITVNKWDLAKERAVTGDYEEYLTKLLPGLKYAPIAFTTATEAKNVQSVLGLATEIFKQATTWIPTAKLNKAFEIIKREKTGATKRGKVGWPKIYYATQIAVNPVTILMFVNKPELFEEQYLRFIIGRLRELLPIDEVPIRLLARKHRE